MKKETVYVALCNQKGGVGKSAMTILLAGYYHTVQSGPYEREGYAYCRTQ